MTTELHTPSDWELRTGIYVHNRHNYYAAGHTEESLISYEQFYRITEPLTVEHRQIPSHLREASMDSGIAKPNTLSKSQDVGTIMATAITSDIIKAGSIGAERLLVKSKLVERIETMIEQWRESLVSAEQGALGITNYDHEEGIIIGLELALQILEES